MPFKVERGGIEAPPREWRDMPLAPNTELREFPDRESVQRYCEDHNNSVPDPYNHGKRVRACYDAGGRVVAIIQRGLIPDDEWREEYDHENFHAYGARHADKGRGWDGVEPGSVYDTVRKSRAAVGMAQGGLVSMMPGMEPQLSGLQRRAQRAAQDIAEALSLKPMQPPMPQGPPTGPQGGASAAAPPGGALQAPRPPAPPMGPGGMPQQRPAMSPLQMMPTMRSPPMEAVLQGPQGAMKPVGFARGGFVVPRS